MCSGEHSIWRRKRIRHRRGFVALQSAHRDVADGDAGIRQFELVIHAVRLRRRGDVVMRRVPPGTPAFGRGRFQSRGHAFAQRHVEPARFNEGANGVADIRELLRHGQRQALYRIAIDHQSFASTRDEYVTVVFDAIGDDGDRARVLSMPRSARALLFVFVFLPRPRASTRIQPSRRATRDHRVKQQIRPQARRLRRRGTARERDADVYALRQRASKRRKRLRRPRRPRPSQFRAHHHHPRRRCPQNLRAHRFNHFLALPRALMIASPAIRPVARLRRFRPRQRRRRRLPDLWKHARRPRPRLRLIARAEAHHVRARRHHAFQSNAESSSSSSRAPRVASAVARDALNRVRASVTPNRGRASHAATISRRERKDDAMAGTEAEERRRERR